MKLTIVAVLVSLSLFNTADAYYYGILGKMGDKTSKIDRVGCIYNNETSLLMCLGKSDKLNLIECEASMKMPEEINYDMFAIESPEKTQANFHLIPRKKDNTCWAKHWVTEGGQKKFFTLYHSDEFIDYGLKVKDTECFEKIVELLKTSTRHEIILTEGEQKEKLDSITIISDLSVFEKLPRNNKDKSKRWWYGWGWNWGYPYYGYSWGKRDTNEVINDARDASSTMDEIDRLRRQTEVDFEVYDEKTESLIKEVNKLKREVKMLSKFTI